MIDEMGIWGSWLHYAIVLFFTLGAFLLLLFNWKQNHLSMGEEAKEEMLTQDEEEIHDDSEGILQTKDAPIPLFLKCLYVFLIIWGLIWSVCYYNGSPASSARPAWSELQKSAHTKWSSS